MFPQSCGRHAQVTTQPVLLKATTHGASRQPTTDKPCTPPTARVLVGQVHEVVNHLVQRLSWRPVLLHLHRIRAVLQRSAHQYCFVHVLMRAAVLTHSRHPNIRQLGPCKDQALPCYRLTALLSLLHGVSGRLVAGSRPMAAAVASDMSATSHPAASSQ